MRKWCSRPALGVFLLSLAGGFSQSPSTEPATDASHSVPADEVLSYKVEWRLVHAGNARLSWRAAPASNGAGWQSRLELESVGLVSRLYKVNNQYSSVLNESLCAESSFLAAKEGSRRRETEVKFDSVRMKALYSEHDLVKNTVNRQEIDIPACVYDVIGALYRLRTMSVEVGQTVQLPISDGKKSILARVEAQEREQIRTDAGKYSTIRYEAFLFNNVFYRRRGRLFVWLTDDVRRVPVQIRVRLPFYIGTVTLQLQTKEGKA
jgi:hypothetical protein